MIVIGFDPGAEHTGCACLDTSSGELLGLATFPMTGGPWRAALEKVYPFLEALPDPDRIAVERLPPTVRSDTRWAKSRANTGWVQGWTAGVLATLVNAREAEPLLPTSSDWRPVMQVDAARHRLLLDPPRRIDAEQIRDWWKMAAVSWVQTRWPEAFAAMAEGPLSRARKSSQAMHHVAGVADACEAAGVALWAGQPRPKTAS